MAQGVEIDTNSPQMVGLGLYVEPIERLSLAFDLMWIDMEQFGNVDISISVLSISTESDYRDTYATTFSVGDALTPEIDLLAGFSYVSAAIADADRSLSLPIDRIYIIGVGAKYRPRDWFELFVAVNYTTPAIPASTPSRTTVQGGSSENSTTTSFWQSV